MRRLLPYEYQLVKHLGVTEEEYLTFLALQQDFTRSAEEKLEELQAGPAVGTVALVLTIVGTLFQVAAALLAPKPEQQAQNRNRRDQVFAPRFGFNSSQELAKYGDAVNLVYTNKLGDNPEGGVRVNTSLVWSAVRSFGTSQYMQLLMVVGGGRIGAIDPLLTAFGQTPVSQFVTQRTWTYFNGNGPARVSDAVGAIPGDPAIDTLPTAALINQITLIGDKPAEGFSQAFSPSTLNRCGVFAPIPIRCEVEVRDEKGKIRTANLGVNVQSGLVGTTPNYWPEFDPAKARPLVPVGYSFVLRFRKIDDPDKEFDDEQTAIDTRRALYSFIDGASLYKLGSAKYKIVGTIANGDNEENAIDDLEKSFIDVTFECVESGVCPQEDYGTERYSDNEKEAKDAIVALQDRNAELSALLAQNGGQGPPIFLPEQASEVSTLQEEVNQLNDGIEDLRAVRGDRQRLRDIEARSFDDPTVRSIIDEIDQLEEKLEQLREIDNPTDEQRKKKRQTKKEIKRLEDQLKYAILQYGLANGVDNSPNANNIRQLIKNQKRDLVNRQRRLALLVNNSAYWDYASMAARNSTWQAEIDSNNVLIDDYKNDLRKPNELNDYFNTKCLVKIEEASYATITECRVVDFALKARVFKRVSGRAKTYGEVEEERYKDSDNGVKFRSFFFWLLYRQTGQTTWQRVPRIFVIRRSADIDNFVSVKFIAASNDKWEFRFDPVAETAAEMRTHGLVDFAYVENKGQVLQINLPGGHLISFRGRLRGRVDQYQAPINRNPYYLDEWGLFSLRSDTQLQFSFDQGPEMTIVAVTEQRQEAFATYPNLYNKLAMLGFNTYSGQGIQDLRSISVFVTQGKWVRRLRDDGTYPAAADGPSSFAPDIFLDTILDTEDGIGQYAKPEGLDLKLLALSKRFCRINGLFFDGVIAQQTPWRQFWAEVAPYSLLELARVGGKEALIPAVPCDNAGNINRRVTVSSMFTAGNILEDSYKEDFLDYGATVQDLIATVLYRETNEDEAFPRNTSVEVRLNDVVERDAIRQTFDLSQYVTSREQAIMFAKLLCNQRRHIRRGIEFRTFPSATVISPGAYIYVDVGNAQWDSISSGIVEVGGALNTPVAGSVPNGTYSVLLWKTGEPNTVAQSGVVISGNTATGLAQYAGWLFVLGAKVSSKRVFRVVEVTMDEEGEVGVKAVEHPCYSSGTLSLSKIAQFSEAAVPAENHPGFAIS